MCDTTIPPKVHGAIPKYAIDPKNVSSKLELEPRRIPGYMGYVAGTRNEFGDTFGRTTATALKNGYEYEGYRSAVDQLEQRRKTAAGLGVDKEGMFYENAMTLSRDQVCARPVGRQYTVRSDWGTRVKPYKKEIYYKNVYSSIKLLLCKKSTPQGISDYER